MYCIVYSLREIKLYYVMLCYVINILSREFARVSNIDSFTQNGRPIVHVISVSHYMKTAFFRFTDQIRHKPDCTVFPITYKQRTNGPVNAHLRPEKYTNKLV